MTHTWHYEEAEWGAPYALPLLQMVLLSLVLHAIQHLQVQYMSLFAWSKRTGEFPHNRSTMLYPGLEVGETVAATMALATPPLGLKLIGSGAK